MSAATPPASGPLAGYRVLELCNTIAGPACTRLFADFGAEVIKVEPPEGDSVRQIGLPDEGIALFAASILRNKRAVTIDLKTARGRELVLRLAAECDLVVENFRPGTLERLGLGYEALSAQNPGLVLVRISGYGQSGPRRAMPGYGAICEAYGGVRHLIGDPERPPPRVAVPVVDYLSAAYAAYGAVLALLERQRSGRGQVVDCALYEAAFSMLEASVPAYDRFGYVPNREGSRLPYMAPNNLYPTRDGGYVLIAANNDATFRRLMQAIGRAALLDDPRYATINSRWEHVDALDAEIGAWTAARDAAEIGAQLDAAGVPCSRVYTLADAAHDPHYAAREMLLRAPHSHFGELLQVGIVPKLSATPGAVRWSGPELSADTRAVLAERLGLSDAELDALEAEAVIRSRRAAP
ncbi:CaiB/BaiF CoA transferase family protein [Solimonas variicoloris]|uniref:CaiB/BaiF CoA transferase family protein n=1 Tax=Solimonas variicoloris TaxID=254408 RepID=UPI000375E459|nr:CoA transferase [Solimonas variicoloris]